MSTPPSVSILDLKSGKYRELENPDKNNFRNVVFGRSMEWDFRNGEGIRIPGRVYLPPDFDESKKYPLIVYYYGGTTPVSRSFGGRYPFNMYAANGYVVYVLQPSGAIGFGQEFSSMHVNNWGITVADEIIQGTREFLTAHPFADPDRVGCMGASYGGFMTMLLQTRTDIFAAAISHAGISSISSYWGEGYWGYGYSAEASAESFPWNNRTLYVDQSPLFSADRINTPLLLLHGSSDTNVPPGESIQLYVALKLLGKPVELVEIEGEDHHIITYNKRMAWSNTKLAWFDKWLKNQPQWWEYLYPEKNL
jgi:dipeptidyl aminopeptidase/acylaminoacyl peptidase